MKTVTLRIDDLTYALFRQFAETEHRPLSSAIEVAARQYMQEHLFAHPQEMREIHSNKALVKRLKAGAAAWEKRKGRFVA